MRLSLPENGTWVPTKTSGPRSRDSISTAAVISAGGPFKAGKYFAPYANPRLDDGPQGEHLTARLAEETVRFIEDHSDQPFFAYLAFYSVHTPLMAPADLVNKYEAKAKRLGLTDREAFGIEEQVWESEQPRRVRQLQSHATYAAMVESMDSAVGRVLDTLDELGLADNTIVCLTSDNGGLSTSEGSPTSNLPLRGGKGWLYEGGIREAFLIRAPGTSVAAARCDVPVVSTDFYPTLLELTGSPPRPLQHLDGVSLVPLLRVGTVSTAMRFTGTTHTTVTRAGSPAPPFAVGPGS